MINKIKSYNRIKFVLSMFMLGYTFCIYSGFLFLGYSSITKQFAMSVSSNYYLALTIYLILFSMIEGLLTLPFSFYDGYFLEHKYQQSNQKLKDFFLDDIKGFALKVLFLIVIFNIIYALIKASPENWGIYATGACIFFIVLITKFLTVILLPIFYKLTPIENKEIVSRLKKLCEANKIKLLGVYSMNLSSKTKAGNGALTGLGSTKKILLSDNILDRYTPDEIEAIMAHEIGHYLNGDIVKGILLNSLIICLAFYAIHLIMRKTALLLGLSGVSDFAGLPLLLIISTAVSIIAMPIVNTIMRRFEYNADSKAISIGGNKNALASTLTKLSEQNLGEMEPNPIKEFLFHSHPSPKKRIEQLN